ncbi:MAG: hypothetical protein AB7F59_00230 [Bdellovibrionales bacterium]
MSKLDWVRDLVRSEQQLEEADMVDFTIGFDGQKAVEDETHIFLEKLKESFVDYSSAFNQMKGVAIGNIKIYGIANTKADFMLFRNGQKMIFTMKKPGTVAIKTSHSGFVPGTPAAVETSSPTDEDVIEAQWGAFNELHWCFRKTRITDLDNMVRFYLSRFIRESAR